MCLIKDVHLWMRGLLVLGLAGSVNRALLIVSTAAAQDNECWWFVWRINLLAWQCCSWPSYIKDIWTPPKIMSFDSIHFPASSCGQRQGATSIKRMRLMNNSLWREESMHLIKCVAPQARVGDLKSLASQLDSNNPYPHLPPPPHVVYI